MTKNAQGKKTIKYIDNAEFSQKVHNYVMSVKQAEEEGEERPIIPNDIAVSFIKIAKGLCRSPNFSGYTYTDEMIADAVEACVKAINNYDITKKTRTGTPNAFAYFTQICYYAFQGRLNKEKKQRDIRDKIINTYNIEDIIENSNEESSSYIENMGLNHNHFRNVK